MSILQLWNLQIHAANDKMPATFYNSQRPTESWATHTESTCHVQKFHWKQTGSQRLCATHISSVLQLWSLQDHIENDRLPATCCTSQTQCTETTCHIQEFYWKANRIPETLAAHMSSILQLWSLQQTMTECQRLSATHTGIQKVEQQTQTLLATFIHSIEQAESQRLVAVYMGSLLQLWMLQHHMEYFQNLKSRVISRVIAWLRARANSVKWSYGWQLPP